MFHFLGEQAKSWYHDTGEKDGVIGGAAHQPQSEGDIWELVQGGHHHAEHQDGQEVPGEENHQAKLNRESISHSVFNFLSFYFLLSEPDIIQYLKEIDHQQ